MSGLITPLLLCLSTLSVYFPMGVLNSLIPMSDQGIISPYNIKQTSDENKEKHQLGDYKLIQYQILQTYITRTVWLTVRRIAN